MSPPSSTMSTTSICPVNAPASRSTSRCRCLGPSVDEVAGRGPPELVALDPLAAVLLGLGDADVRALRDAVLGSLLDDHQGADRDGGIRGAVADGLHALRCLGGVDPQRAVGGGLEVRLLGPAEIGAVHRRDSDDGRVRAWAGDFDDRPLGDGRRRFGRRIARALRADGGLGVPDGLVGGVLGQEPGVDPRQRLAVEVALEVRGLGPAPAVDVDEAVGVALALGCRDLHFRALGDHHGSPGFLPAGMVSPAAYLRAVPSSLRTCAAASSISNSLPTNDAWKAALLGVGPRRRRCPGRRRTAPRPAGPTASPAPRAGPRRPCCRPAAGERERGASGSLLRLGARRGPGADS